MAELVVRLSGKDELSGTLQNVQKELENTGKASSQMQQIEEKFNKITESSAPLKKQLRDLQTLMAKMNYEGLDATPLFTQMAEKAGQLKDAISDANTATSAFANDNMKLEAMAQSFSLVASAGSIATGAMGLFGVENDKVAQTILKVQSAMAILNGIQQIANVLNKDSALMLRMRQASLQQNTTATATNTVAIKANAEATKGAIVATNGLNTAGKGLIVTFKGLKSAMGGWIGLALGAITVIASLVAITKKEEDAIDGENKKLTLNQAKKEAIKELNERLTSSYKNYANAVSTSIGGIEGKFRILQQEYQNLKTEQEKLDFVNNNAKNGWDGLGLSINNVVSANKAFLTQSDDVLNALKAQAALQAKSSYITELFQDKYRAQDAIREKYNNMEYDGPKIGDTVYKKDFGKYDINSDEYLYHTMTYDDVAKLKRKFYERRTRQLEAELKESDNSFDYKIQEQLEGIEIARKEAADALKNTNGLVVDGDDTGSDGDKPSVHISSLKYAQDKLNEYRNERLTIGVNDTKALEQNKKNIDYWQKEVEKREKKIGAVSPKPTTTPPKPLTNLEIYGEYETNMRNLQREMDLGIRSVEDAQVQEKKFSDDIQKKLGKNIKLIPLKFKTDLERYKEILSEWEKIQGDFDKQFITKEVAEAEEKRFNDLIKNNFGDKFKPVKLEIDSENSLIGIEKKINELQEELSHLNPDLDKSEFEKRIKELIELSKRKFELKKLTDFSKSRASIDEEEENPYFLEGSVQDIRVSYGRTMTKVNKVASDFMMGIIKTREEAQSEIKKLTDAFNAEFPDIKLNVKINEDGSIETITQNLWSMENILGGVGNAFNVLGQSMQSLAGDNEGLAKSALIASAIGQLALTFASSMKGTVTPWDWIAGAVAGVATLTSVIASLQSFSTGGIVGGTSFSGDRTLIRANAGEMVLNKQSQQNLYNAIRNNQLGNNLGGGKVEFVIDGRQLKGVLNNYNNKMSKVR